VAGVTYNPISNEMFWAEKGKGAYLNDKRLRVAARRHLDETVLATGIPFIGKPGHAVFLKELHQVSQKVSGVRRFGSAALDLAYVAAGRFDGYWERGLQNWDMAAGTLLVTEAGGKVTDADGDIAPLHSGTVLASSLELHPLILETLKGAR
jgi:myo-inositol-1(or 4)-monophosphatase